MEKQNRAITPKVDLDGIKPAIWRQIAVDGDITLRALHHIMQAAFGWTGVHLHEFRVASYTDSMLDNEEVLEGSLNDDDLVNGAAALAPRGCCTGLPRRHEPAARLPADAIAARARWLADVGKRCRRRGGQTLPQPGSRPQRRPRRCHDRRQW